MSEPNDPRFDRSVHPVPLASTTVSFSLQELADRKAAEREAMGAAAPPRGPKALRGPKDRFPASLPVSAERVVALYQPPVAPAVAGVAPAAPLAPSPAPLVSFEGGTDDNTSIPPDTAGAVSEAFVFEALNNNVQVFDRAGTLLSQVPLDDFWRVLLGTLDAFDPRAAWDPFERRFIFVAMANAQSLASRLLIAVSETDDPRGNWIASSVAVDPAIQGPVWLDFPSLGFTDDKITVQVNLFTVVGNAFAGSSVYVWEKSSLYQPPHNAQVQLLHLGTEDGACQVPATTYDAGESTQYLVSRWTGDHLGDGYYAIHEITGSVAGGTLAVSGPRFVQLTGVTWQSFPPRDLGPQAGIPNLIDLGDDRVLSVVLRKGCLWASHTAFLPVGVPIMLSVAQWIQVQVGAWSVLQMGRYGLAAHHGWIAFPSLAVNQDEDALLGFAHFGPTQFGSGGYALRRAGDAPGTLRGMHNFAPGGSPYFKTFSGAKNRWGDYSATQVDPVDDLGFWTVQEHASMVPNTWTTRWAQV